MEDSLKTLFCPACGKEMEKIFIEDTGFHIDVCSEGCGGIYFDPRELKHFDDTQENVSNINEALANKELTEVDTSVVRACPYCGVKMVKHFANSKQLVEIDECYSCGGIFLDNGELEKIRGDKEVHKEEAFSDLYAMFDEFAKIPREGTKKSLMKRSYDKAVAMPFQNFVNKYIAKGEF